MRTNTRKFRLALTALTLVALVLLTVTVSVSANDPAVTVLGNACPFFAGQTLSDLQTTYPPWSPGNHANFHNDTSDAAMMPPSIPVCGGGTLSITASGTWGYGPGVSHGPGGAPGWPADFWSHEEYDNLGISLVQGVPGNLLGVFLGDGPPSTPAPSPLSQHLGDDMTTPELQQAFIIGASLSDIQIPAGATRLFFGYFDGYEWNNNQGSVEVSVTMICLAIEKTLSEGPAEIGIYLPEATEYVFEIAYSNPDPATPVRIIDTVPAEFECVGDPVPTAGTATCSKTGGPKSANRIVWDLPVATTEASLTVEIRTVASPGRGHKDPVLVFKPTSCGPLPLNDGAVAYEVDPLTGEIVKECDPLDPLVCWDKIIVGPSDALGVEAVAGAKTCAEADG